MMISPTSLPACLVNFYQKYMWLNFYFSSVLRHSCSLLCSLSVCHRKLDCWCSRASTSGWLFVVFQKFYITSILFYLPQKDKVISNLSSLVKKNWRRKTYVRYIYHLKRLIKDQLQSSYKDSSEEVIYLLKRENILKKKVSKDVALRIIGIRRNECVTWLYLKYLNDCI